MFGNRKRLCNKLRGLQHLYISEWMYRDDWLRWAMHYRYISGLYSLQALGLLRCINNIINKFSLFRICFRVFDKWKRMCFKSFCLQRIYIDSRMHRSNRIRWALHHQYYCRFDYL